MRSLNVTLSILTQKHSRNLSNVPILGVRQSEGFAGSVSGLETRSRPSVLSSLAAAAAKLTC